MNFTKRVGILLGSPTIRKIVANFSWLMGGRGLTMILSLAVNIWLARYLGPELFGVLNYAVAFVGLFGTFTYLGISGIVVRDLVEQPEDRDELLGTVFVLKLAGALLAMLVIGLLITSRMEDGRDRLLIAVLTVGLVFESVGVIAFWYQSRVEAKYTVRAAAFASVTGAALKCTLIVIQAPLVAFVVAIIAQQALSTTALLWIYQSHGHSVMRWRFQLERAKSLLSQSWPLALSSIGAVLYLKIDQVMIGHFVGKTEVGIYAVAVKFSEVWYFIPTALAASLFPKIVQLKQLSDSQYRDRMQRIYRIMVVAAFAVAIPVTATATPLISSLYGSEYLGAAPVLMIHIWACPAIFMAAVLSKWLISEGLLIFSLTRHGLGALANVGLNIILIPRYGAIGAAIATVVSYTVASYLACFSDRRTFTTGVMMTKALFTPFKGLLSPSVARAS